MANILISGGSGLVGRAISEILLQLGHEVRWLSRVEGFEGKIKKYPWDLERAYIDEQAFEGIDILVHLAGAGIVDHAWTEAYKEELLHSRVKSTELLFHYLIKKNKRLKAFIGGSAIGYYGSSPSSNTYTETDLPGADFLSQVCNLWEQSYIPFQKTNIRTVIIRTGIVLSKQGGAYAKMKTPFQYGLGAAIGNGKQAFPWIHLNDLANIFIKAMFDESMQGVYNAVASEKVTNKQFSKKLANSFMKPLFLPNVPKVLLQLILGERAITLSGGVIISNDKIKSTGFVFKYDELNSALKHLAEK